MTISGGWGGEEAPPGGNNKNPPSGEWEAQSATRRDAAQMKRPARGLPADEWTMLALGLPRKWRQSGTRGAKSLIVHAGLGWACHCAGISITKSVSLFHHVPLGWMLITVQPLGHAEVPRVMVSFVPSSAGQ